MVKIPDSHEEKLDIIWGCIRYRNEHYYLLWTKNPTTITITDVARELGWSYTTCEKYMKELYQRGQLTKRWNHRHQSYWSAHWQTLDEHLRGGNPVDLEVEDIPF